MPQPGSSPPTLTGTVTARTDVDHAFRQALIGGDGTQAGDTIIVADLDGAILTERTGPAPGIRYIGDGRPRGTRPRNPGAPPKS